MARWNLSVAYPSTTDAIERRQPQFARSHGRVGASRKLPTAAVSSGNLPKQDAAWLSEQGISRKNISSPERWLSKIAFLLFDITEIAFVSCKEEFDHGQAGRSPNGHEAPS